MRRLALITASLMLCAAPAGAQIAADQPSESSRAAELLKDPAQQQKLASTISAMLAALMKVNVGPLADVVAKVDPQSRARDLPRDATLGDVVGRDERDAQRLGDQVQSSAQLVGSAAATIEAYLPMLKSIARDMATQVERNARKPVE